MPALKDIAIFHLGTLLGAQPSHGAEAAEAFRTGRIYGIAEAQFRQGFAMSRQRDEVARIVQQHRDAIAAGDVAASYQLGLVLASVPEREAEAEQAFGLAAAAGNVYAMATLEHLQAR